MGWDESVDGSTSFLDTTLRRDFKRAKLSFEIIKRESDPNAKFDLFQRLNAGSVLSLQEARNCLLIMINRDAFLALSGLADSEGFAACISISDQKENAAYRSELVLRFFAQMSYLGGEQQLADEFGEYLTTWMKREAESNQVIFNIGVFERTFKLLQAATDVDTFRRYDGARHLGPFSISSYEFITSGVSQNLDFWEKRSAADLAKKIRGVWNESVFRNNSGSGVSSRKRFPRMVLGGRSYFAKK